jgi:hypothetical protein
VLNTSENIWDEIAFFECSRVSNMCRLVIRRPVDVVKNGTGKSPTGQFPKVMIIETMP